MKPKPIEEHRKKSTLRRVLNELAGRLGFSYYDMYYSQVNLSDPEPPARSSAKIDAETAQEGDLASIRARLPENPLYWFNHSIEAGSVCLAGRLDGEIFGYAFANYRTILLLDRKLETLPEGFVYIHNTYIFSEFRGQGLYTVMVKECRGILRSQGIRHVASLVDRMNLPSQGPAKRFGTRLERARVLCMPGVKPIVIGRAFRKMREAAVQRNQEGAAADPTPEA